MKTAGIAIVTRLAADFCKDAKEGDLPRRWSWRGRFWPCRPPCP